MNHNLTIDELEKEIHYLREQNQKLIKELSETVKENSLLHEELALGHGQSEPFPKDSKKEKRGNRSDKSPQGGEKGGISCLSLN